MEGDTSLSINLYMYMNVYDGGYICGPDNNTFMHILYIISILYTSLDACTVCVTLRVTDVLLCLLMVV